MSAPGLFATPRPLVAPGRPCLLSDKMEADRFQGIGMTSQRSRNRLATRLRELGIKSERVLAAIASTPRHIFIDEALASRAYDNTALPIGHNQTISQPYIVARMTEALLTKETPDKVLEVGAGCGYQTAILAQFARQVYSVERLEPLVNGARERCHALGHHNIRLKHGDGSLGWPENAPYNGILVAAAPLQVPEALLEQLAPGGRLIIPVGRDGEQKLISVAHTEGKYVETRLDRVSFVPMREGKG